MMDIASAIGYRVVTRTNAEVSLNHEAYFETILDRFQIIECNPITFPMNTNESVNG